jgi:hypothetical protein
VKKGRHRRYEEARALKRGGDLDIDSIFSDLSDEQGKAMGDVVTDDTSADDGYDDEDTDSEYPDEDPVRD